LVQRIYERKMNRHPYLQKKNYGLVLGLGVSERKTNLHRHHHRLRSQRR
jgi:hypothetical protein